MNVLHDEHMPPKVGLGFERLGDAELPSGLGAYIGLALDELPGVRVFDLPDQVGVEHDSSLEDADHHQIESTFLGLDGIVVVGYLLC